MTTIQMIVKSHGLKFFKRWNIKKLFIPLVLSSSHYLLPSLIILHRGLWEIRFIIYFRQF